MTLGGALLHKSSAKQSAKQLVSFKHERIELKRLCCFEKEVPKRL